MDLKPCPFCGATANLIKVNGKYQVVCNGYACLAKQGGWDKAEYAIMAWNKRAE